MEQGLDLEKNPEISNEELQDLPWVSIVLPTYNRAAEIKRSIQSILEQTYRRLHLHSVYIFHANMQYSQ